MSLQKALLPFLENFELGLIFYDPQLYLDFADQAACLRPYPLHPVRRRQVEAAVTRRLALLGPNHPACRQVACHYQLDEPELVLARLRIELQRYLCGLSLRPSFQSFADRANGLIRAYS